MQVGRKKEKRRGNGVDKFRGIVKEENKSMSLTVDAFHARRNDVPWCSRRKEGP